MTKTKAPTIGQERLRTLYAVLRGVPSENVNLRNWRTGKTLSDSELMQAADDNECGTTGCAIGWACAYPEFKIQGLHMDGSFPAFDGFYSWCAVGRFFDLSYDSAEALFSSREGFLDKPPLRSDDHKLALARIRRFLLDKDVITPERNAELAAEEGQAP